MHRKITQAQCPSPLPGDVSLLGVLAPHVLYGADFDDTHALALVENDPGRPPLVVLLVRTCLGGIVVHNLSLAEAEQLEQQLGECRRRAHGET